MNYIPKVNPLGREPIVDPVRKRVLATVNGVYVVWVQDSSGKMKVVSRLKPGHMVGDSNSTYIPHDHYVGMMRQVNAVARDRFNK